MHRFDQKSVKLIKRMLDRKTSETEAAMFFSDELPQFGDSDELKSKLSAKFATKTRDEWTHIFDALPDSCVIPVLELHEAPHHPQNLARKSFVRNTKGKFEPVGWLSTLFQGRTRNTKLFQLWTTLCQFCEKTHLEIILSTSSNRFQSPTS